MRKSRHGTNMFKLCACLMFEQNQSTAALRSELAKLRMQHKHMTRELQATTARTADTESRAQQTITALQRELEQARMGPQLQSGDNTAQAIHALGSRQAEVRAYKGATAELRNYLQALTDAGKPVSNVILRLTSKPTWFIDCALSHESIACIVLNTIASTAFTARASACVVCG